MQLAWDLDGCFLSPGLNGPCRLPFGAVLVQNLLTFSRTQVVSFHRQLDKMLQSSSKILKNKTP